MDYESFRKENHLRVEIDDRLARVTLDRPDNRNAVNHELHRGIEHLLPVLEADPDVGAILLTGEGTAFCAGGDVKRYGTAVDGPLGTFRNRHLARTIATCEVPMVAAVNGPALGLGAVLALLCDVVFMAESARIGDTHVRMGLTAGDGGQAIWPLLVGLNRAKEYLMTGRLLDGREAERIGLVNHCVPDDELMARAEEFALELAHGPRTAIRFTKVGANKLLVQNLNLMLELGLMSELVCAKTEDCAEAIKAFSEKRKPHFTGR